MISKKFLAYFFGFFFDKAHLLYGFSNTYSNSPYVPLQRASIFIML